MTKAIIAIILVLAFIVGGMVTLLKSANKHKLPDNYDKSKVGFDDEEDDWPTPKQANNLSNTDKDNKDQATK